MTRSRTLLVAAVAGAAAVAVVASVLEAPKECEAEYRARLIRSGMAHKEVQPLFGNPVGWGSGGGHLISIEVAVVAVHGPRLTALQVQKGVASFGRSGRNSVK